jgi:integrase
MSMAGRDTRTRYQGVFARHKQDCEGSVCDCTPSYFGVVWDREAQKQRKTPRFPKAIEARNARADLLAAVREGRPVGSSGLRLEQAAEKLVAGVTDGVVLNKYGRRYRSGAVIDLRSSLAKVPAQLQARRLDDITRGDVQRMVDTFHSERLSGSRIRSIVNALRTLYRWAQEREFASRNPAAEIRLPAMDATPRDRVATPAERAELLSVLEPDDQVPFAIAAHSSARAAEIRALDWSDVDLQRGAIRLAGAGGKSAAARRVVPLTRPLATTLKAAWLRAGRPSEGRVCAPRRSSRSGELATGQLLKRAGKAWKAADLVPITLHQCRHSCATWLDHAGVSPKVASEWMGHATPGFQPGAAAITLSRYTHVLDGEMEQAREQLDAFLADRAVASPQELR